MPQKINPKNTNPQKTKQGIVDLIIITVILLIAAIRIAAIAQSPLGLDVEEAQYWQWSTTPDLGYFTKPPMIAWLIGISTWLFGASEFGVRAFAPLMQAAASLLMMALGRSININTGRWAALIWMSLPITALGGFVISTDSPMICFYIATLIALAPIAQENLHGLTPPRTMHMRAMYMRAMPGRAIIGGGMLGLAVLSKYAALYLLVGLAIFLIIEQRRTQKSLKNRTPFLALFCAAMLITITPNILWNIDNGFATAKHLSHNANLEQTQLSLTRPIEFIISQMAVAGPIIAALAIWTAWTAGTAGTAGTARKNPKFYPQFHPQFHPQSRFWIALAIPPLATVIAQAFRNDANANWALAAWPPLVILLATTIAHAKKKTRPKKIRLTAQLGIAINAALALIILIATTIGTFGALTPASDPLRRLRGWSQHAQDLAQFSEQHNIDAIITTRREHIAKLLWHQRDDPMPIELVTQNPKPKNHFEQRFPWHPTQGRRIAFINTHPTPPASPHITWLEKYKASTQKISTKRHRQLYFHLGTETSNIKK